jgi:hypothetical protein
MAIQVPRHSTRTVAATLDSNRSDAGQILPHADHAGSSEV